MERFSKNRDFSDLINAEGTVLGIYQERKTGLNYMMVRFRTTPECVYVPVKTELLISYLENKITLKELFLGSSNTIVIRKRSNGERVYDNIPSQEFDYDSLFSANDSYLNVSSSMRLNDGSLKQTIEKLKSMNTVEVVSEQVWNILSTLRGSLAMEEFKPLFMSLWFLRAVSTDPEYSQKNFGVQLPEEFQWDRMINGLSVTNTIQRLINVFGKLEKMNPSLKDVFSFLKVIVLDKKNNSNAILLNSMTSLDHIDINGNISFTHLVFDQLLQYFEENGGQRDAGMILPKEIAAVMKSFMPPKPGLSIFNPFAGCVSFTMNTPQGSKYLGQELVSPTFEIAKMRMALHGIDAKHQITKVDSFQYLSQKTKDTFDFIVSAPPFNRRLEAGQYPAVDYRRGESLIIDGIINRLSENGIAVLNIPFGFLFRGGEENELRKRLVELDLIEYIIGLPANLLFHTGIPTFVLVLNKAKKNKGYTHVVDASQSFKKSSPHRNVLDLERVLKLIQEEQNPDFHRLVLTAQIEQENFNLNVSRYFMPKIEHELASNEQAISLKELGTFDRGEVVRGKESGKIVKIKDLQSDALDFELKVESLSVGPTERMERKVSQSCILLSTIQGELKPTYFEYKGAPIYVDRHIVTFTPNVTKVLISYIVNELNESYVKEQIKALQVGGGIPRIALSDIGNVKIKVVKDRDQQQAIEKQHAKIHGIRQAYIKSREKELALEKEVLGLKEDNFRELASMKHTFRQYLSAMASNVKGTRKFIKKREGAPIHLSDIYSKNLNQTLDQHLSGLEETVGLMSKLLSDFGETKRKTEFETINLQEMILDAQRKFKCPDLFQFEELDIDEATFEDENGELLPPLCQIVKDDFYILFSNIVENAKNHGFIEQGEHYQIKTSLSVDLETKQLVLKMSNNGKAASVGFSQKDLTTRGEKTSDSKGAGTGGADIRAIIENWKGQLIWTNNIEEEFPVCYTITLPFVISSES